MSESLTGSFEPEKKTELKDFEEALSRLEGIVGRLESGELALEEAVRLFEEGMTLSRFCGKKLDDAQRRVEMLVKNEEGEMSEVPFNADVGGEGESE
jgi:exodeoxyribonuclease VII small subunit